MNHGLTPTPLGVRLIQQRAEPMRVLVAVPPDQTVPEACASVVPRKDLTLTWPTLVQIIDHEGMAVPERAGRIRARITQMRMPGR